VSGPKSNEWCEKPFEGFTNGQMVGRLSHRFQCIEGRIKTLLEAILPDTQQCKAAKDVSYQHIWTDYEHLLTELRLQ